MVNTGLNSQSAQTTIDQRKGANRPKSTMVFPSDLGTHCTLMRFFEYSYGGTSGSTRKSVADIVLPLPRQIQDSFKINVGGDELGILGSGAAQLAANPQANYGAIAKEMGTGLVKTAMGIGKDAMSGNLNSAIGMAGDVGQFLIRASVAKVEPDIANGISAGRGTAINPFATLVFKGVDLKVHSLEWLLSPESEEDSRRLKNIIRTMQNMVLPKVESVLGTGTAITSIDRGILRYPAMVDVYFQGIDMNYYFKFKTSMISQFNVDYTPNGISINKGGRPSAIRITMTLNEAYIHTAEDYNRSDLAVEEAAEVANENNIRIAVNGEVERSNATGDTAENSSGGKDQSTLGVGGARVGSNVPSPDGKSNGQATTTGTFSDEVTLGGVTYTINQLVARGVDRATILANPSVYVPSTAQV
jgi:hypothetical protein